MIPTSWSWDFGDGHTGSRQNPTHTYAKAGDYQVKLTVSNVGGSDSKTRTVTVKPVPPVAADFTSKQAAGTLDVRFTDGSTGKPTTLELGLRRRSTPRPARTRPTPMPRPATTR